MPSSPNDHIVQYKVRFFVNDCISVETTYFNNSCRLFWVSWAGSKIRVGTGATVIMEYQDPTPLAIKSVAVSTGWGSSGSWKLYDQNGKHMNLHFYSL